mgnify:CR=1 FL=1
MTDPYHQILASFCDILQKNFDSELVISQKSPSFTKITGGDLPFVIHLYRSNITKRICDQNEKIVHIDEDMLHSKYDIIVKRILALALHQKKAYARKTVVARVYKKNTIAFLEENHLQGAMPGKYRYGLFLDGELISLAVFSGGRKMPEFQIENYRSFELIRFCNKLGYNGAFPLHMNLKTTDKRGANLHGFVSITLIEGDLKCISCERKSGDPLEWRRLFKKIALFCRELVLMPN